MKTKKVIIGTIVAAIVMFFLGWVIYGMLVGDLMGANCDNRTARPMEDFIWWSMMLSNLIWAFLICVIISWRNTYTAAAGARVGAMLGFFAELAVDLSSYAMSTFFGNVMVIFVDALSMAVLLAITGAVAGLVMSKVRNKTTD